MSAEALEEAAKKTKKNAAEVSEKAEHDAEQAKVAYAETSEKIKESKCENNPACDDANLKGFCCPTLDGQTLNGTMLGCCGGRGRRCPRQPCRPPRGAPAGRPGALRRHVPR